VPSLSFHVESVAAIPFAAGPMLGFQLRISNRGGEPIQAVSLRCQIQIEPTRRRYTQRDQERLLDLFGEVSRWGQTLRTLLWTHANAAVQAFTESTVCELPVLCTFDFNVAATKYFHGLEDGTVPLCLQFSGTVFYVNETGSLQASPISWNEETRFELPIKAWKEMMDLYYPDTAWVCLRRDVFDRLYRYKVEHMIPTWEEAVERFATVAPEVAQ
jgi:uncharacterized protein DUF6084